MITIAVLTYNSPLTQILMTLKSIILQEYTNYELLICDDASLNDHFDEIQLFLARYGITNYRFIKHDQNIGTVKNFQSACRAGTRKYVKIIGAGDLFYSTSTLSQLVDFMELHNSNFTFGVWGAYAINPHGNIRVLGNITYHNDRAPQFIEPYSLDLQKLIQTKIIVHTDWISGATMAFNRENILQPDLDVSKTVTYCEDLVQYLVALRGDRIDFFPEPFIWYEKGMGISSNGHEMSPRLHLDHEQFFGYVSEKFKDSKPFKRYLLKKRVDAIKNKEIRKIAHDILFLDLLIAKYRYKNRYKKPSMFDGFLSTRHLTKFVEDL